MAPSTQSRLHATVRGRVQGVFFRAWTQQNAEELNLNGWVRNTPEGNVELVAEGPTKQVEELARRCHQGPPAANVTEVITEWESPQLDMKGFQIRR